LAPRGAAPAVSAAPAGSAASEALILRFMGMLDEDKEDQDGNKRVSRSLDAAAPWMPPFSAADDAGAAAAGSEATRTGAEVEEEEAAAAADVADVRLGRASLPFLFLFWLVGHPHVRK
jgi:hypothetical protein